MLEGKEQGPVSVDDLKHVFDSTALPMTTPVWCEGMKEWVAAETIQSLLNTAETPVNQCATHEPHLEATRRTGSAFFGRRVLFVSGAACFLAVTGLAVWTARNKSNSPSTLSRPEANTSKAVFRLDMQDLSDIRNDRIPTTVTTAAKRAGIDQNTLISIVKEKQAVIKRQGDPAGLLANDGELFWGMIYDSLISTMVRRDNLLSNSRDFDSSMQRSTDEGHPDTGGETSYERMKRITDLLAEGVYPNATADEREKASAEAARLLIEQNTSGRKP
jgi:hypothetical protein